MTSHFLQLFTILALLSSLCLALKTNKLSTECLCDISDACDFQCCCDSNCDYVLLQNLKEHDKCADDGFGIPYCAGLNETDINRQDLYSGLSTIYTVIRRLFCIERVNIVDPTTFYQTFISDDQIDTVLQDQSQKQTKITAIPNNIKSLSSITVNGLFTTSAAGTCTKTDSIRSKQSTGFQSCRAKFIQSSIATNPYLSVDQIIANMGAIKVFDMGSTAPTDISGVSTMCISGSGSCLNIVRSVKIYLSQGGQINTDYSYVVVSDLDGVQDGGYINVEYSYQYLNSGNSFAKTSNIGYQLGAPLLLLKKFTISSITSYFRVQNPINLAFRQPDGFSCRTQPTDSTGSSLVKLTFGRNQVYSCYGDTSLIYQNLKESFNYVSKMGGTGSTLGDFTPISWPTIDPSSSIKLNIYYLKVGAAQNPQYYITNFRAQGVSTINKQQSLYIQYQEIQNTPTLFIPPPPRVHAYLPNDFLYPFYVAQ